MKILVTGIRGQLGHDVVLELQKRNIEAVGVNSDDMNITDKESVDRCIDSIHPDAVIHCAAWTAVDAAEDEQEACNAVNVSGTEYIAEACRRNNAVMMYFSTDYVFDGEGTTPWKPEDKTAPIGAYGSSKCLGEEAVRHILPDRHFIIRLQWVYGINGKNFVKTMLRLSETHDRLTVVSDQVGGPSYTKDIARVACDMIATDKYGTYHVANTGYCSWYEFARAIFEEAGRQVEVVPVSSEEYPAKAKRPHNSRLDTSKLKANGFEELPPWQDALHRFIQELRESEADR